MTVDYADEDISNINKTRLPENIPRGTTIVNKSSSVVLNENAGKIVEKGSDHVYSKYPIIGMWAKPSVRSGYSYRWYYKTFIDYCPHCHHYNVLLKNPKGVPEREYTCRRCGADYCAVTGKEKYSWSHYYLRRA